MTEFVAIEADADAGSLENEAFELIEAAFEGWEPAEGNLEVWLVKAFSRIGSQVLDQASFMSREAFKRFGETIISVPPVQSAPATAESLWTMVDNAGYSIPAGTQVAIDKDGETSLGFVVAETVEVPNGSTTGPVLLRAVEGGEAGNGLTADPQLIDSLAYVLKIELEGTTANGVDEESEDDYLNRLVETLQLLSLSLIVGADFEKDARAVPGVHRAKAIEAYNADESKAEPLAVSVYPVDEDGQKLSAEVKEELKERQEAKVPSGVSVFVADPKYTAIKVKAKVVVREGFDSATVLAAVKARLEEYLDPANWGVPSAASSSGGWDNKTVVYRFELVSEVDRVGGVERVSTLELVKEGGALGTADVTLEGKVPLTEAGSITVEAA